MGGCEASKHRSACPVKGVPHSRDKDSLSLGNPQHASCPVNMAVKGDKQ